MESKAVTLSASNTRAVIFDLDGVVTKTAKVHARAWKQLFDDFLQKESEKSGTPFVPFDIEKDYLTYVDGKPRADGVRSFLESRGINLPMGASDDPPEQETVWGLGNKKNVFFIKELKEHGVEEYPSTVELIHHLKEEGIKVGIISSSKNCVPILTTLGIIDLFDTKIDGLDQELENIKGKPAPDVFLEAAKRLGATPENSCVVEDAISGVQAGAAGNFSLVIGVDRQNQTEDLLREGADVVVKDLEEVEVVSSVRPKNAFEVEDEVELKMAGKKVAIFLDYDGTLTPIMPHSHQAVLSDEMRNVLKTMAKHFTVAIISGRDLQDVKERVGIENIFYAGSHGFDIEGPGHTYENPEIHRFDQSLMLAEKELSEKLKAIDHAWVDRKKFTVTVHFRQVDPSKAKLVEAIFDAVLKKFPDLRKSFGKKVLELSPNYPWNKGKALDWMLKTLRLEGADVIPIYIGDDLTDEDAFVVIKGRGIGIVVQDQPRATFADYMLKDPGQVQLFLQKLTEDLFSEKKR